MTDGLTPKQKEFLDLYLEHRSMARVAKELGVTNKETYRIYRTKKVQDTIKEFNETLQDKVLYDAAVIIDKLWNEYSDEETPKNVKLQILVWLGKHIGMWANSVGASEKGKGDITYNIVNYGIEKAIENNKEEVEKIVDKVDLPDGIVVTDYSGNA